MHECSYPHFVACKPSRDRGHHCTILSYEYKYTLARTCNTHARACTHMEYVKALAYISINRHKYHLATYIHTYIHTQQQEAVAVALWLDQDYDTLVFDARSKASLAIQLALDIADALNTSARRVNVVDLHRGSVVADVTILPDHVRVACSWLVDDLTRFFYAWYIVFQG